MNEEIKGTVFNIQRFSVHDGPGIRTVVFLKGCPLKCRWCANPESQKHEEEAAFTATKCIGCKKCEVAGIGCRPGGADMRFHPGRLTEKEKGLIEKTCPSKALHVIGYRASVSEVLYAVDRDHIFYGDEEGGLTISGGEPLMQPEFTYELLKAAGENGINTCIETTAYSDTKTFLHIASKLDYLLMDIKSLDSDSHKRFTGVRNELILKNFRAVREAYPLLPIHVRTPVIPGFNDSDKDIKEIHDLLKDCCNVRYELLKYHRLGISKYESLGREYPMGEITLEDETFESLKKYQFNRITSIFDDHNMSKGAGI